MIHVVNSAEELKELPVGERFWGCPECGSFEIEPAETLDSGDPDDFATYCRGCGFIAPDDEFVITVVSQG